VRWEIKHAWKKEESHISWLGNQNEKKRPLDEPNPGWKN
jgi:hypothetical protein